MPVSRSHILSEITRLASENDGSPLGKRAFETETGIRESDWSGVYWARWGDAVREAGFVPQSLNTSFTIDYLFEKLSEATLALGHLPTTPEMRLRKRVDPDFPNERVYSRRFNREEMTTRFRDWLQDKGNPDVIGFLPDIVSEQTIDELEPELMDQPACREGVVYLLKFGDFFKIGRTENIERRIREISVALPEKGELLHSISTDDTVGIESYWHQRFATKRAEGEWFKLTSADVKAFRKRRFQ